MKSKLKNPLIVSCIAVSALCASCADPYAGSYAPTQTVTTYRTGYEVRTLPSGYRTETIGGTRYYTYNGTYYQPRSGRYVVVEAPRNRYNDRERRDTRRDDQYSGRPRGGREVTITKLPPGYRIVKYRGTDYYQARDVYYQRRGNGYVVVERPN